MKNHLRPHVSFYSVFKTVRFLIFLISLFFSEKTLAQSFYDINTVQKIEIQFKESNWDYKLDTAKAGSEGFIMAQSVKINGIEYDSVGVKYKGNSTYNATKLKNPFHIELDTYKDHDIEGYTDIKLSNVAKDPSFIREVLSYSILRQYMAAPLSNYANVYVNGTLVGLYVSSESVGKKFVRKHFNSKNNAFFKCNPLAGAGPSSTHLPNLVYLGTDSTLYFPAYEMNSSSGWSDLIKLSHTLKNNIGDIESILDVDKALWMLAFDNVTVNLDSYIGQFAQNYYLYKSDNGQFNCVLWDFNEGLGGFSGSGTLSYTTTSAKSQMTQLLHAGDANWPLIQKLLAVPRYKKMYLAHFQTILNENFTNNSYKTKALSYQSIINSSVQADPNKSYTYAQYQSNLTSDVTAAAGPGGGATPGITTLMTGRNTYLSALTDFTNAKPVISEVEPSDTNPAMNSSIFITAKVLNSNTSATYLGFRDDVEKKFTKVLLYDDGNHGEGSAGDLVFGAKIPVSGSTMQYYIYAENNNAGAFSPARAEYEFYSVAAKSMSSDVVMNEIYSQGSTTDPDWIELYNSSLNPINIGGYKIYDKAGKAGEKPKKEFPAETIIPSNGFFVLITDDVDESGFGLSNSGEEIFLENALGIVVDSVLYPAQIPEQSYGRVSNGGNWQLMNIISKGSSNVFNAGLPDKTSGIYTLDLKNFPNPIKSATTIQFTLSRPSHVLLEIYNSLGQLLDVLENSPLTVGIHRYQWNSGENQNGVYLYRLKVNDRFETRKMILLK